MFIISILLLLFYLPILICDRKKIDETLIDINEYNIWSKFMGIPEGLIIKNGNNLFRCINCNWNPNTSKIFIPELTTIKNPESYIKNNNITEKGSDEDNNYKKFESKGENYSVIFSSMKFQYSVVNTIIQMINLNLLKIGFIMNILNIKRKNDFIWLKAL